MKILRICFYVISSFVFGVASAFAGTQHFECPKSIIECPTVQENISAPWIVVAKTEEKPLERVGIALGPKPLEFGEQVPTRSAKKKKIEKVFWDLFARSAHEQNWKFWLECYYVGTRAMTVMEIPNQFQHCVVSYESSPALGTGRMVTDIECW